MLDWDDTIGCAGDCATSRAHTCGYCRHALLSARFSSIDASAHTHHAACLLRTPPPSTPQAKELLDHLEDVLSNKPIEVISGNTIVEAKPQVRATTTSSSRHTRSCPCMHRHVHICTCVHMYMHTARGWLAVHTCVLAFGQHAPHIHEHRFKCTHGTSKNAHRHVLMHTCTTPCLPPPAPMHRV